GGDPQTVRGIVADGVHRHDVRVLESREDLRLVSFRPRHLDRHRPPPQVHLLGEIHPREGAPTQLPDDPESRQLVPWPGETPCRSRPAGPLLPRPMRVPGPRGDGGAARDPPTFLPRAAVVVISARLPHGDGPGLTGVLHAETAMEGQDLAR